MASGAEKLNFDITCMQTTNNTTKQTNTEITETFCRKKRNKFKKDTHNMFA